MSGLAPILRSLLARAEPAVMVSVAAVQGSAPREAGTHMIVTAKGSTARSAAAASSRGDPARARAAGQRRGRRRDEAAARARDRPVLRRLRLAPRCSAPTRRCARSSRPSRRASAKSCRWCCCSAPATSARRWRRALAPLPLRVRWIDGRADAFPDPAIARPEVVVSERLLRRGRGGARGCRLPGADPQPCARFDDLRRGAATRRLRLSRPDRLAHQAGAVRARLSRPRHSAGARSTAWSVRSAAGGSRDKRPAVIAALVGGRAARGARRCGGEGRRSRDRGAAA